MRSRKLGISLVLIASLGSAAEAGRGVGPESRRARGSVLPAMKRLAAVHRAGGRLTPAPRHVDAAPTRDAPELRRALHDYARTYARWLHRYNGSFPAEQLVDDPRFRDRLEGAVPYWDVDPARVTAQLGDPARPRVELIGLEAGSPFVTADGKLRIYAHYLNGTARRQLTATFGAPTGHIPAMMTSSFRTIILLPEDGVPFQLKFSGDEATPWGASKQLPDRQVETSVERGVRLRKSRMTVPEPSGLLVGGSGELGGGLNAIYRPLPLPEQPGDRLITWHVLMSPEFRASPEGRAIFARHGGVHAWFRSQAAPKVAELIAESMLDSFAHFELHSQNVDLLLAADGSVRQAFAKDLLDLMHDPGGQAASGRTPVGQRATRDGEWGDAADSGRDEIRFEGLGQFYGTYFSQLGIDALSRRSNSRYATVRTDGDFRGWVLDALYTRVAKERDVASLARFPDFAPFASPARRHRSPYRALDGLRNAIIKDQLGRGFRSDPSVRARFEAPGATIVSSSKQQAQRLRLGRRGLELGTVGRTPVAIVRDRRSGLVRDFYFAFDGAGAAAPPR
jgi:hypothetical protein